MRSSNKLMNNRLGEDEVAILTASLSQVMRSFRSFSFFKPANAIFVPGMYWERYQQRVGFMLSDVAKPTHLFRVLEVLKEGLLVPGNTLVHVGSGVREAIGLTSLTTEHTKKRAVEFQQSPLSATAP